MEENKNKRQRSINWTKDMKDLLVNLVQPHIGIIDSKLNNTQMIRKKFDAWECISGSLEANGYKFTPKQVREQWNRMKVQARSNVSIYKKSQQQTGGRTPPKEPTELDLAIDQASDVDFTVDSSEFDSDAMNSTLNRENESPDVETTPKEHKPFIIKRENESPDFETTPCEQKLSCIIKIENESPDVETTPREQKSSCILNRENESPDLETTPREQKSSCSPAPQKKRSQRKRCFPTAVTSEELVKKRLEQVEYEVLKSKIILDLKEKVLRKKLEKEEKEILLLDMKIKKEQQ